jgi:ATP-dependent Clp protease ATP-binding subunit ClpB
VILLDEIEKAHNEVFDVLLQILDDGRLTDGQGRTVDFRNTVLIMTSNLRSQEQMREFFRPEFLNRIDEIVEFKPLTKDQLGEIVELQLARLRARLADRGLELELTDEAKQVLADAGWDPTYGARPLKRALQRMVENPLALRLLEGEFGEETRCASTRRTVSSSSSAPARASRPLPENYFGEDVAARYDEDTGGHGG